jgi:secreted trypsin-like serine protease
MPCLGGKDSCGGDSGGPLVARDPLNCPAAGTLLGVVNRGLNGSVCGRAGAPGVYADITYFLRTGWLAEKLRGMRSCPPRQSSSTTAATTARTSAVTQGKC